MITLRPTHIQKALVALLVAAVTAMVPLAPVVCVFAVALAYLLLELVARKIPQRWQQTLVVGTLVLSCMTAIVVGYIMYLKPDVRGHVAKMGEPNTPVPQLPVGCIEGRNDAFGRLVFTDDSGRFEFNRYLPSIAYLVCLLVNPTNSSRAFIAEKLVKKTSEFHKVQIDFPAREIDVIEFPPIYFDHDRFVIPAKGEGYARLCEIIKAMEKRLDCDLVMWGHASLKGDSEYNLGLTDRRLDRISRELTEHGISENRLIRLSCGEKLPLSHADTPDGSDEQAAAENRAVRFLLVPRSREYDSYLTATDTIQRDITPPQPALALQQYYRVEVERLLLSGPSVALR